jgi:hydroxymethylglutaryl-CoA lyase
MQGLPGFVPTAKKITYLNMLLKVGFDTLDFGSFVSPKAIPQMADTQEVLAGLDLGGSSTKLLAIVANDRGVDKACSFPEIAYLGFPLSISETFQQRNTNASIGQGIEVVKRTLEKCSRSNKELVVYLSMGFGNPYGDEYSEQIVLDVAGELKEMGTRIISLADTVGLANESQILQLGKTVTTHFSDLELGMHLHSRMETAPLKIEAWWNSGIRRIDTALGGLGGCPMAEDELVGNLATETFIDWANEKGFSLGLDMPILLKARMYLQYEILS